MTKEELYEKIVTLYEQKFAKKPEWVVKCPGRVNIIGEHIDYSGYSVLPMSIEQSMFIAVGKSTDKILHFINLESEKYSSEEFLIKDDIFAKQVQSAPNPLKWYHYFIAGWRGAVIEKILNSTDIDGYLKNDFKGLNIVVGSSIPPSAGLSSSSALVCGAVMATWLIYTNTSYEAINKNELAQISIQAEPWIGTESGGMDQACECLAQPGTALRIDFSPLHSCLIPIPKNALFAVLHCGLEMNKGATTYYNQRVVECRIAAQILCKKGNKLDGKFWHSVRTLKQAAEEFFKEVGKSANMLKYVEELLEKPDRSAYTRQEVCEILAITDKELKQYSLNNNTQNMQVFCLAKRARHVFSEAERVLNFEKLCKIHSESKDENVSLDDLAKLMNDSHTSCRDDFECSCKELDTLIEKCRAELKGCLAARLTGAGWGGCVIALVDKSKINNKEFENNNEPKILFWSKASAGIQAFKIKE